MDADINSILSSLTPGDMENLRGMASQLFGSGGEDEKQAPPEPETKPPDLSGIDPQTLTKIMQVMAMLNSRERDSRCDLIEALKPHLSGKKQKRADEAMQMLRLLDIMPLLGGIGGM